MVNDCWLVAVGRWQMTGGTDCSWQVTGDSLPVAGMMAGGGRQVTEAVTVTGAVP